jgi:hypothetical protein
MLRLQGAVEVVFDSFDARWEPGSAAGDALTRQEYLLSLEAPPSEQVRKFRRHHRRHLQIGVEEGWTLRVLEGEEARALLHEVLATTTARAASRGDPFSVQLPGAAIRSPAPILTAAWGMRVFSAWHGATPLAAVLVGWANRRAYNLESGSTVEGYRRSARVWLQWSIMSHLAEHRFGAVNLGGTAASAAQPEDPAYGVFFFKTGFGSQVVPCRGARWTFNGTHMRAHRFAKWALERFGTGQGSGG